MELGKYDKIRFDSYMEFLTENGANSEILALPAIQELIGDVISRGDPRVKMDGRSPVAYLDPNPDGTFPIGGRTAGPVVNERYDMEYCIDDGDNFIKLTNKTRSTINPMIDDPIGEPYDIEEVREIIINREGKIVSDKKDWDPVYDDEETVETEKGMKTK